MEMFYIKMEILQLAMFYIFPGGYIIFRVFGVWLVLCMDFQVSQDPWRIRKGGKDMFFFALHA